MQTSTETTKKAPRATKAPVVEVKKTRKPSLAVKARVAADKLVGAPTMRKGAKAKRPTGAANGGLAQSEVFTNPAPHSETKVMATPKAPTKASVVAALLSRPKGATNQEIMDATGWQTHSVRGFLAHLKKAGTRIEKTVDGKTSTYRIVADEAV